MLITENFTNLQQTTDKKKVVFDYSVLVTLGAVDLGYQPEQPLTTRKLAELLTFTDRASYFLWRDEWRSALRRLVIEIREEKGKRKTLPPSEQGMAQRNCYDLGGIARNMMFIRLRSKQLAGKQMRASRNK